MPAETLSFALTDAAYTQVSVADAVVILRVRSGAARIFIGSSAPAATTDNWYPLDQPHQPLHLEGLTAENIYARAEGAAARLHVIRA